MKVKRVFVTGGAQGIGAAIVRIFSQTDAKVAFCDVDENAATSLCQSLPAFVHYYKADVKDAGALTKVLHDLFTKWGDIDIIINNAGISEFSPITDTSVEQFERILSINLRPVFITARTLALHRKEVATENNYGRIINIASTRAQQSETGSEGYAASKGGMVALTHALAMSLSQYHITVNCISPGWIQTKDYEKLSPSDHRQHPSGRVGQPDDIARACLFLCAPENDFINGENIIIDGGMSRKMIYEE